MSEFDIKLISLVEKFPHLYDKCNVDYKNKKCNEISWKYIADEFKVPVADCISRWQSLRNRYSKERAKMLPSGGAGDQKEWVLYKYLGFLHNVVKKRKNFGNIVLMEEDPLTSTSEYVFTENIRVQEEVADEHFSSGEQSCSSTPSTSERTLPKKIKIETRPRTVSGASSETEPIEEAVNLFKTFVAEHNACIAEQASVKSFCDSLVEDLSKMNPSNLRKCKIEMLQIIMKYSD